MSQQHTEYWVIHNKKYDMSDFIKYHPGGEHTIILGKGRDCTELFENTHCMCDKEKINKILEEYYVDISYNNSKFDWSNNPIYREIMSEVKLSFENKNYKADSSLIIKIIFLILLWSIFYYFGITNYNFLSLFLAGVMWTCIGFCIMHDGSHSALSKNVLVNWLPMMIWNNMSLWNHTAWMLHHVYGHHGYTGIGDLDPDLNYNIVVKSEDQKIKEYGSMYKYQHYYSWIILFFLPNQSLSVALNYRFFDKIFGLEWLDLNTYQKTYVNCLNSISLFLSFGIPIYVHGSIYRAIVSNIINFTGVGLSFYLIVLPNHDSIVVNTNLETMKTDNPHMLKDWSVQQIVSSANFSNTDSMHDKVMTYLLGGMNYQIEHHLFPTICHIHYPRLSLIVKKICAKYNIPYVVRRNIFDCIKEHYLLLKKFSVLTD